MKSIRAGKAQPSRVWELVPDGKGGFVRRQIAISKSRTRTRVMPSINPADEAMRARQRLGLSQDTFAELLGVSAGTLRDGNRGDVSLIVRLACCCAWRPSIQRWCLQLLRRPLEGRILCM
jgi:DNA-binding XRE family transcriptional regulator